MSVPVFLSIAGSDCSAGAGAQADLKTGFALGCYPLTALTCVVSEVPGRVSGISAVSPEMVRDQVSLCLATFPVAAVKCGMLYSPAIVRAVVEALEHASFNGPVVVDPVMVATAGEPLMLRAALRAYRELLFPRALLLTPNRDELEVLTDMKGLTNIESMRGAAMVLAESTQCGVLAKGGHVGDTTCTDLLVAPDGRLRSWSHPRTQGISTHGTGCTLSSAITAFLARGEDLSTAVEHGLSYVAQAIATSHRWPGIDALNHGGIFHT